MARLERPAKRRAQPKRNKAMPQNDAAPNATANRHHPTVDTSTTRRSVGASLAVNFAETAALGAAAVASHSSALRAQTVTNAADMAVGVFLLIGVLSSVRPADEDHPLGYGRERFFWSLFAALAIFVGGGGLALNQAIRDALHPTPIDSYAIGYVVLAATVVLDGLALRVALRTVRQQAADRGISLRAYLPRSTDPAAVTVLVSGACAVIGAVIAAAGLFVSQLTASSAPDTVASALIGLLLLVASVLLLKTNRELLSGHGVPPSMLHEMRRIVAAQEGVAEVQDLFAVVVGPASLIVEGDISFEDDLDVPAVEHALGRAATALRERWSSIDYIYLTPVAGRRGREWPWNPVAASR
jgi:cation diffusion facilitator family transporter